MLETPSIFATCEFRVVLVDPASYRVLVFDTADGYRLPRVRVSRWLRLAQELQRQIQAMWGVRVVILNIVMAERSSGSYVIAELLMPVGRASFKGVMANQLPPCELSEREYANLELLLNGNITAPFSYIGWIDDAIRWAESETGRKLTSKNEIEQYCAGGGFALVRFPMIAGLNFWLKATGEPNRHEPRVTKLLSELGGGYIPDVIAWRPEWNAVLISGEAQGVGEMPREPRQALELLEDAVESMARLQMQTEDYGLELLEAGAFNQGMEVLLKRAPDLFDYLEEMMGPQASVEGPYLDRRRIHEIRTAFEGTCERVCHLGIPETILHGDMNPGNITTGCGHCQFIDWSEAYVGNRLVTLQNLLLLNRVEDGDTRDFMNCVLKRTYLDVWRTRYDSALFEESFTYMPLLGAISALYGRGDWLTSPKRNDLRRGLYARRLALHMDVALRAPELQEALC